MAFIKPCFGVGHNLSLICQMTSEDIKHQLITTRQEPALATRNSGKKAERRFEKKKKKRKVKWTWRKGENPLQYAKHAWLYYASLFQILKTVCDNSRFPAEGTLISSSIVPHCWVEGGTGNEVSSETKCKRAFEFVEGPTPSKRLSER